MAAFRRPACSSFSCPPELRVHTAVCFSQRVSCVSSIQLSGSVSRPIRSSAFTWMVDDVLHNVSHDVWSPRRCLRGQRSVLGSSPATSWVGRQSLALGPVKRGEWTEVVVPWSCGAPLPCITTIVVSVVVSMRAPSKLGTGVPFVSCLSTGVVDESYARVRILTIAHHLQHKMRGKGGNLNWKEKSHGQSASVFTEPSAPKNVTLRDSELMLPSASRLSVVAPLNKRCISRVNDSKKHTKMSFIHFDHCAPTWQTAYFWANRQKHVPANLNYSVVCLI